MQRYDAYKDSGVEWIGEIPEGWEVRGLKTLAANDVRKASSGNGSYIGLENIQSWTQRLLAATENDRDPEGIYYDDDCVLFGKLRPYLAKVHAPSSSGACSSEFLVLKSKVLLRGYLSYLLINARFIDEVNSLTYGAKMPRANWETIGSIPIPFPSTKEQAAIADYLDGKTAQIDSIVSQTERSIGLLREYRKSVISEAVTRGLDPDAPMKDSGVEWIGEIPVGWACLKVKNCCDYRNGLTYSPDDISESGTRVLRSSNVQDGKLAYEDSVFVDMDVPEKAMAHPGDVLICSRNGSKSLIGKNALIDIEGNAFGAFMMIARPRCNCRYFFYLLNSGVFDFYLPTYLTSTVNQLTGGNFGQMVVPFSKNECEQQAIADYLDEKTAEIDSLIDAKQRQVELLKEYRKSLISEAVTGKFKVPGLE
ncbi:MAG: restriction endonuclease subunit S [Eggerthellaceae bacterium]